MRVPLSWLREYAPIDESAPAAEVARRLTAAGLEVESVEAVGHVLLFPAQADGLANKEVRKHEPRRLGAGFVRVRVGKGLEAKGVTQAEALPHKQIRVKLGPVP